MSASIGIRLASDNNLRVHGRYLALFYGFLPPKSTL
jgi:hypothetical protein